mgnify:CR=1 FL=1
MTCFSDQCAIDFMKEDPVITKSQPLLTRENENLNEVKFPVMNKLSTVKIIKKSEDEQSFCSVDNDDCVGTQENFSSSNYS